ncbi:hypothetical protein, partial [Pseudovibrio sp. WM33]|uniref:hypothetical protein n=1 Tax=Pseudovibrio sp. WM33 TaxID=1735585 RepID=UPI0019D3698B
WTTSPLILKDTIAGFPKRQRLCSDKFPHPNRSIASDIYRSDQQMPLRDALQAWVLPLRPCSHA